MEADLMLSITYSSCIPETYAFVIFCWFKYVDRGKTSSAYHLDGSE